MSFTAAAERFCASLLLLLFVVGVLLLVLC
jgi:hypothetical protein